MFKILIGSNNFLLPHDLLIPFSKYIGIYVKKQDCLYQVKAVTNLGTNQMSGDIKLFVGDQRVFRYGS